MPMALKRKISKEVYDALPEAIKAEYKAEGSDYVLDVDDASELTRALDRQTQLRKDAEAREREIQKKLDDLNGVDAKRRGDIETLERSWNDKLKTQKEEADGKIGKLTGFARKTLIDGTAASIASKISTVPALMKKVIADRLAVDFDGETPTLKVLDAGGNLSASSLADLEKEIVDNKEYSSIIIGSKAKGSNGTDNNTRLSGNTGQSDKQQTYSQMSARDFAAELKAKKEAAANA